MTRVPTDTQVPPSALCISRVEVHKGTAHDVVRVWNRGGHSGELRVVAGDGEQLARWLMPDSRVEQ